MRAGGLKKCARRACQFLLAQIGRAGQHEETARRRRRGVTPLARGAATRWVRSRPLWPLALHPRPGPSGHPCSRGAYPLASPARKIVRLPARFDSCQAHLPPGCAGCGELGGNDSLFVPFDNLAPGRLKLVDVPGGVDVGGGRDRRVTEQLLDWP